MKEEIRIKSILDAIDLLFEARDKLMNAGFFIMLFTRHQRIKKSLRLKNAQADLLSQLDLGGWNCFKD